MGNLAERDYLAYRKLFDLVVDSLPPPNLLIYLKCPVTVLMDRIRKRARNMETGISAEYLSLLESFYEEWLRAFDLCPVLTIHTDDLDLSTSQWRWRWWWNASRSVWVARKSWISDKKMDFFRNLCQLPIFIGRFRIFSLTKPDQTDIIRPC